MQGLMSELTSMHHEINAPGLLTHRQQEVIVGVANGMTTKQIAASLGISAKTAEWCAMRCVLGWSNRRLAKSKLEVLRGMRE
jgi:FixJ family two-component response regulator